MIEIFLTFLKLGLTSFGGPVAHLGFFHNEFVTRKKWLREQEYGDLVALCQLLPGPASSQVGIAVGFYRGGVFGSILAWTAFTLPSALLLILFAILTSLSGALTGGWLHGLKIAAVAVVAQAVFEMAKKFCASVSTAIIGVISAVVCFYYHGEFVQISVIAFGAIAGMFLLKPAALTPHQPKNIDYNYKLGSFFLILFFILLIGLPLLAGQWSAIEIQLASVFYRIGALVFGGGHVVLPLIQSSVVDSGWVSKEAFIAGYGAAQAVPGPLFSLSAYLGFVCDHWIGAAVSLVMIFLPSFFLVIGVLPYWEKIRSYSHMKAALIGVNAVVVGLLLAALYNPVWISAIFNWKDFLLAALAFTLLTFKKTPSYLVVVTLALVTGFL